MQFSERLKILRKELDLTQDDLARACNVKLTAISKYENELVKPGFDMLSKMGLAYSVNLNWLINDIGSMFLENSQRRLIKDGTNNIVFEIDDAPIREMATVETGVHSLELTSDLKVEYYGPEEEPYTKIYRKTGEVECLKEVNQNDKLRELVLKLQNVVTDKNKLGFILTALSALDNDDALNELKILIKGMELSKSLNSNK